MTKIFHGTKVGFFFNGEKMLDTLPLRMTVLKALIDKGGVSLFGEYDILLAAIKTRYPNIIAVDLDSAFKSLAAAGFVDCYEGRWGLTNFGRKYITPWI